MAHITRTEALQKLRDLPVATWRYNDEAGHPLHVGPMAQDFFAAFGFGGSDLVIATVDYCGALLLAIQALADRVDELEKRLSDAGT